MNPIRGLLVIVLLVAPPLVTAGDPPADVERSAVGFSKTAITLPDTTWRITRNTPAGESFPAFEADWRRVVMIRLGETGTGATGTADASAMLSTYEASTGSLLKQFERLEIPTDLEVPDGWTCRAYRTALSERQTPDSVDLACYAPYPGGSRTLMVEIKNSATPDDRSALQQALLAIRLLD